MTDRSGQAHARANRSRSQGKVKGQTTSATSGPLFAASSPSANLQRALESRLRQRLDGRGSPLYALTWKHWDMLSGPRICALRASVRRTSGSDCGGWATPRANKVTDENAYTGDSFWRNASKEEREKVIGEWWDKVNR